jgi:Meiotically Up-regulated Gene 113 (MUG113) protein
VNAGKQVHPYIADGYGRTDATPETLIERLGGREAAWEAARPVLDGMERRRLERWAEEAAEACRELATLVHPDGQVIYYIRFCCRVKIGTTMNLDQRLAAIPHDELLATEPGDRHMERQRHYQFAASRTVGEWFDMTPELFRHLLDLRGGKPWTHMPDSWIRGMQPST